MKRIVAAWLIAASCGTALVAITGSPAALALEATGTEGLYRVDLAPPGPLAVNTMQSWIVTVTGIDGQPVERASIQVTGGMPAHGHGLPTAPAVTAELGDGRYQLDGVKFNMAGQWVLELDITAPDGRDKVLVELNLQP